MRICLLGDALSVHLQRLASGIASRGLDVRVVTHKPAHIRGVHVEKFRVPSLGIKNPRRWDGRRRAYLRGLLRDNEIVNVHFLSDWGLTPDLMCDGQVIATAWGSDVIPPPGEGAPSDALVEARRLLLHHAAAVTACGPTFAQTVADFGGLGRERVTVVPFGVDVEHFKPTKAENGGGIPSDDSHGRHVSRVGFYKGFRDVYGPSDLLRAIPLVLRELPATRFELVGDGPQLEVCKAMASERGIHSSIEWIPRQPHESIPKLLARWDLTVIPSVTEAFGVAALESAAAGVPVVAFDVGGLRDTICDGVTGRLVRPRTPAALAESIVALLMNRSLRRRMGAVGPPWARERFDQRCVLDQWTALYRRVHARACVPA